MKNEEKKRPDIPYAQLVDIRMRCIDAAARMIRRSECSSNEKHFVVNVAESFERHVLLGEPVDILDHI